MNTIQLKLIIYCCCFFMSMAMITPVAANNGSQPDTENIVSQEQTIFKTLNASEVLTVTIKTNLDSIILNKNTEKYFPAQLTYQDETGIKIDRKIKVKPRGKSRRKICDFPPLKVKFCKKELAKEGISESHKSLKLVTHCNDESGALQNVLEEYLAYKIYNELTNNSLKVQLVKVNYEDTGSEETYKRYAILIEDIDELAERLGGKEVEGFGKSMEDFMTAEMNTFAMFQYMIGNEDWRVPYMRNIKFVQTASEEKLIPIPYDFDASGIVSANYAKPDRDLRLQTVRQRSFMGNFKNKKDRAATVAKFIAKKAAIYEMIEGFKPLNSPATKQALSYLDAFYEVIETPRLLRMAMPVNGKAGTPSDAEGSYRTMP